MKDLRAVLGEVADEQDAQLEAQPEQLSAVRERILRASPAAKPSRGKRWPMVAVLAAAAAVLLWFFARPSPISARLAGGPELSIGQSIAASELRDSAIQFSDGSSVLLHPNARGRVLSTSERGAHFALDSGMAVVSVTHRSRTAWRFDVGPFLVRVTGTRFNAEWNLRLQRFRLEMQDGSVLVSGPLLTSARAVVAGQTLEIDLRQGVVTESTLRTAQDQNFDDTPKSPPVAPSATTAMGAGADAAMVPTPSASAGQKKPPTGPGADAAAQALEDWRALARRGDYRAAFTAAQSVGVDAIIASGSASDVLLLSDTARLVGRGDVARRAYLAIRSRFGGSREAAVAAFSLGRLGGGGSLTWFETYLREAPNGSLAREALGRVLELRHQGGNRSGAEQAAQDYLARFPGGPHAQLASKIVASGSPPAISVDSGAAPSP